MFSKLLRRGGVVGILMVLGCGAAPFAHANDCAALHDLKVDETEFPIGRNRPG